MYLTKSDGIRMATAAIEAYESQAEELENERRDVERKLRAATADLERTVGELAKGLLSAPTEDIVAAAAEETGARHLTERLRLLERQRDSYRDRIAETARIGSEEYGLTVGIHAHAAGFMDFEPELIRLLDEVDEKILKICFDTGHHSYAGFDPVGFMKRYVDRISYMHFKDIDPKVKADVTANRTGFYDACGQGIFCNLGDGDVDFPAVRQILLDAGFEGWCTVEQDCDPTLDVSPIDDARANREYLESIGFN